nr:hypothetical protein [Gordonia sp. NB41Y]
MAAASAPMTVAVTARRPADAAAMIPPTISAETPVMIAVRWERTNDQRELDAGAPAAAGTAPAGTAPAGSLPE